MPLPPSLSLFIEEVVAKTVSATVVAVLEAMPTIVAAVREANKTIGVDSLPDPVEEARLKKEQQDAISRGDLPPAGVG